MNQDTYFHIVVPLVREWAKNHPYREETMFRTLNGESITPMRLAEEVAKGTQLGHDHVEALEAMAELENKPLKEVLGRMVDSVKQQPLEI